MTKGVLRIAGVAAVTKGLLRIAGDAEGDRHLNTQPLLELEAQQPARVQQLEQVPHAW